MNDYVLASLKIAEAAVLTVLGAAGGPLTLEIICELCETHYLIEQGHTTRALLCLVKEARVLVRTEPEGYEGYRLSTPLTILANAAPEGA